MKILQVNVVYKKGSTGKITHDLQGYYKMKYFEKNRGEKDKL